MTTLFHLQLSHPRGVTPVTAGEGALSAAMPALAEWSSGRLLFVLTTRRVWELHGARLEPLVTAASTVVLLQVDEGEAAKTVEVANDLWLRMLAAGGKRDSRLVAFGGGSVGDLGGFVAGCFLRGIRFAQVPTTLLAQVDASVGGKTGVDLPDGKNTVGLFHHPDRVVADTTLLGTLPRGELCAGLVEVIKMGFLLDPVLFARVEEHVGRLLEGDPSALAPVVAGAIAAKGAVVERDPEEADERRLLNFGHTLGHAIESACGYAGLRHGEAVGWGLRFAVALSRRRFGTVAGSDRLLDLLDALELPPLPEMAGETLLGLLAHDKKASRNGVAWVLARRLGEGHIEVLPSLLVEEELAAFLSPGGAVGAGGSHSATADL